LGSRDFPSNSKREMQFKEAALEAHPGPMHSRPARISIDALLNPTGNEDIKLQQHTLDSQYYDSYHHNPRTEHRNLCFYPQHAESSPRQPILAYGASPQYSHSGSYRYERFDSTSSGSISTTKRRRPPRPKYQEEEMFFIWYHRVDLEEEWKEVQDRFNQQFPTRQRRGFQGLQCKFYRFIKEKRCPAVREQRRLHDGEFTTRSSPKSEYLPKYGVVQWCGVWYPWMRQEHAPNSRAKDDDELAELKRRCLNSSTGSVSSITTTPRSGSPSDPEERLDSFLYTR
jgi:hypothetical protein